jgi:hypothetical protein
MKAAADQEEDIVIGIDIIALEADLTAPLLSRQSLVTLLGQGINQRAADQLSAIFNEHLTIKNNNNLM